MLRLKYLVLLAALLLALAAAPVATFAETEINEPYVSGIACTNLDGSNAATISISFYRELDGTAITYNDPNPIPAGGSRNYFTPSSFSTLLPDGFLGSAVVSSDRELACNINTQTTGTGTAGAPYRVGTASGVAQTSTGGSVYIPQVLRELSGFSSYLAVQNASANSVQVEVLYFDRNGNAVPAARQQETIPGNSMKLFNQATAAGLPSGFLGSARVNAIGGGQLAVVVNMLNAGTASGNSQLLSYNGFTSGANRVYIPRVVRNYYNYQGGISVQNVGASATTVQAVFTFNGTSYTVSSPSIAPGAAWSLYLPSVAQLNAIDALPVGARTGSAVLTAASGGSIVAIVNEDNRVGPEAERQGQGSTYNGFPEGTQSTRVFFPQITRAAGNVFSGGFQVANTTGSAGTCTVRYSNGTTQSGLTLPANGSLSVYAPSVAGLPNGFNGSALVECTQPVVGIANLAAFPGSGRVGDSLSTSNGLNQ